MRAGVHTDVQPPGEVFDAIPGASVTRAFVAGELEPDCDLIDKVDNLCSPTWAAGGLPIASFKPKAHDVLAGVWDAPLRDLAGYLTDCPPAVLVIHHEPEDDYDTPGAARDFVAAFNHARGVLKDGYGEAAVAYCAMAYQWAPGRQATADPGIWRRIDADWYFVDVYSGNSFPVDAILPEHPGFARWRAEIIDCVPGRAWGVCERGILSDPSRVGTLRRERDWLLGAGADCQLWLWWNTPGTEGEDRWPVDPDENPDEVAAIRELVAACAVPQGYTALYPNVAVCEATGALVHRPWLVRHHDWMNSD